MSELSEKNYKRINFINWALTVPIMLLFAWPYYYSSTLLGIEDFFKYTGSFVFAAPFMLTILHGHVTMALGSVHRNYYYQWLEENPLTYGFFFHPVFVRTRFRLTLILTSLIIFVVGYLVELG